MKLRLIASFLLTMFVCAHALFPQTSFKRRFIWISRMGKNFGTIRQAWSEAQEAISAA